MKKSVFAYGAAITGLVVAVLTVVASPTVHPGLAGESPELGRQGQYSIGTIKTTYRFKDRSAITASSLVSGTLDSIERRLDVRFWYPAREGSSAERANYSHQLTVAGSDGGKYVDVLSDGVARTGAKAIKENEFPLVVMSHGYGGWNTQFSNLAEHIASRGYVVASIDHNDSRVGGSIAARVSFANVLVDRTLDQRDVLNRIVSDARGGRLTSIAPIDVSSIGLVGYSMGGYGALSTAGASYSFENEPLSMLPRSARDALSSAPDADEPIKALVTFAPWGGQPSNRVWTSDELARVNVPVLLVAGNQDDVSGFENGISWIYENLRSSDRYMLVYREARHNIVGNKFEMPEDTDFAALEFLNEPVWRSERLNAINQHFVTAFLDLHLKGDAASAAYLNVPVINSNNSEWPLSAGEMLNGKLAGAEQERHWPGFQRRWAVGLEMHHSTAAP